MDNQQIIESMHIVFTDGTNRDYHRHDNSLYEYYFDKSTVPYEIRARRLPDHSNAGLMESLIILRDAYNRDVKGRQAHVSRDGLVSFIEYSKED